MNMEMILHTSIGGYRTLLQEISDLIEKEFGIDDEYSLEQHGLIEVLQEGQGVVINAYCNYVVIRTTFLAPLHNMDYEISRVQNILDRMASHGYPIEYAISDLNYGLIREHKIYNVSRNSVTAPRIMQYIDIEFLNDSNISFNDIVSINTFMDILDGEQLLLDFSELTQHDIPLDERVITIYVVDLESPFVKDLLKVY